jgi:2-keto-4-pentenoate hydratase/2-oxohepta-3-ene-1,7-dioic acid hydratase in catechol pathway
MFTPKEMALERGWPGRIDGDRVIQLAAQTLEAFWTGGGGAREHAEYPLAEVDLRPPVLHPPSVRVFDAFDRREQPFFSFRNTAPIYGPEEEVPYPEGTEELDFGLGVAAVIGADGAIGGFTLANDWTARDLERAERASGFGPSKSKDFALTIGPAVVTPDELEGAGTAMVTRVNGDERARADRAKLAWSWEELVEHAARNTVLRPGDLLVCSAPGAGSALAPGDVVELEVDGIGTLTSALRPR